MQLKEKFVTLVLFGPLSRPNPTLLNQWWDIPGINPKTLEEAKDSLQQCASFFKTGRVRIVHRIVIEDIIPGETPIPKIDWTKTPN